MKRMMREVISGEKHSNTYTYGTLYGQKQDQLVDQVDGNEDSACLTSTPQLPRVAEETSKARNQLYVSRPQRGGQTENECEPRRKSWNKQQTHIQKIHILDFLK